MRARIFSLLRFISNPIVAIGGALIIGAALVAYVWVSTSVMPSGVYTTVTTGSIQESVNVSGIVQAAHSTNLSFQVAGNVADVVVQVGDHVMAGETLATLNDASAVAMLAGAKAALEVQQANLASLEAGTRPEQLSIDQTNLIQAKQALSDAIQSAYVAVDDAIYAKADQVFNNPRTADATLSIQVPDATLVNRLHDERIALEPMLAAWQNNATSTTAGTAETNLQMVNTFLGDLAMALAETPVGGTVSATELADYQTSVNTGRLNVSGALTALTAADTAEKSAVGALILAQSGATTNDIAAQQAAVDAAQAAVQSAQVAVTDTQLVAPVSGIITAQNADLGETVSPGIPLISMIANGAFEVQASVSENDIGKVAVGEPVTVTFDAYPGVTFPATVTTVDPAATVNNGVSSYGVTVTFISQDPRIKPGLAANLIIVSATRNAALLVPSSAIITTASRQFVYLKGAHGAVETPVTIGIVGAAGVTEITSGLTAGEEVLTFGMSATQ